MSVKTTKAIEMPFASTTLVGPVKHLLHIADRFGRILYCVHSTRYSSCVCIGSSVRYGSERRRVIVLIVSQMRSIPAEGYVFQTAEPLPGGNSSVYDKHIKQPAPCAIESRNCNYQNILSSQIVEPKIVSQVNVIWFIVCHFI